MLMMRRMMMMIMMMTKTGAGSFNYPPNIVTTLCITNIDIEYILHVKQRLTNDLELNNS